MGLDPIPPPLTRSSETKRPIHRNASVCFALLGPLCFALLGFLTKDPIKPNTTNTQFVANDCLKMVECLFVSHSYSTDRIHKNLDLIYLYVYTHAYDVCVHKCVNTFINAACHELVCSMPEEIDVKIWICVYMYMYIYVYMYAYMCIYIYTYTYIYISINIYILISLCIYVYIRVHIQIPICMYIYL